MGLQGHTVESKRMLRSDITNMSVAGLVSAPAWTAFLLWNAVIMGICKRTFLFWLKMALYISKAFLSSVSIWNVVREIGGLSCLIDVLFYLFTEWMKKVYFGLTVLDLWKVELPHEFLWHTDSEKSKLSFLFSPSKQHLLFQY